MSYNNSAQAKFILLPKKLELFLLWFSFLVTSLVGKDCAKFCRTHSIGFLKIKNVIFSIFLINFAALLKL